MKHKDCKECIRKFRTQKHTLQRLVDYNASHIEPWDSLNLSISDSCLCVHDCLCICKKLDEWVLFKLEARSCVESREWILIQGCFVAVTNIVNKHLPENKDYLPVRRTWHVKKYPKGYGQ